MPPPKDYAGGVSDWALKNLVNLSAYSVVVGILLYMVYNQTLLFREERTMFREELREVRASNDRTITILASAVDKLTKEVEKLNSELRSFKKLSFKEEDKNVDAKGLPR